MTRRVTDEERLVKARTGWRGMSTLPRMLVMLTAGVMTGLIIRIRFDAAYAALVGWEVAALTFVVWAWLAVGRLDPAETRVHATREDPSRAVSDLLILGANVGSLGAVAYIVFDSSQATGAHKAWLGALALFSVAVSWVLVQTLFTLRYARIYYRDVPGGVDFNGTEPPSYVDFAYLAFTMGMTYQVSDTNLQTREFRRVVLRHGLLSYVFGSLILATTVNLVIGLSG